jgi:UDP-N-acetyl-2-amino-2-deoxyglucuronate dehydrogenase
MTTGFGIIGTGMIAHFHARAIAEIRGAKLIGAYNANFPKAQAFAEKFPCTPFAALDEMLADPRIHVVTICTPSGAHLEGAIAAAEAGKHVITEKPLEVTLKRCDAVIDACKKAGVTLATIFPSRFHASAQLLKKAVEADRFGKLTLGSAHVKWYRTQAYYDSGAWRGTWKLDGGGALMNQAIHSVDLLLWLMGDVAEVTALTGLLAHDRIEVEDAAVAAIRFKNGALGLIEATTAAYPGQLKRIEISGTAGTAILEEESIKVWNFAKEKKGDAEVLSRLAGNKTGGGAADPAAIGHAAHAALFRDTLEAIKKGRTPLADGREGRRSVELILAIYQSAETGKTVKLPLARDPKLKVKSASRR